MSYLLVDGGATSSRVHLLDESGTLIGTGRSGPASLTLSVEESWESVQEALSEAMGGGDHSSLGEISLVAGLAGARSQSNRDAFMAADPLGCRNIKVVTDGYASLLGALGGSPGIVLAVGTGVTGFVMRRDMEVCETSGWGFPIGDEGGGAWIGWHGLKAFTHFLDGRSKKNSACFDEISAQVGGDFDTIQIWLSKARSTQYASIAPYVIEAADAGDAVAEQIMQAAAAALDAALLALDNEAKDLPIVLLGGLAETIRPRIHESFRARIQAPLGTIHDGLRLFLPNLTHRVSRKAPAAGGAIRLLK